MSEHQPHRSPTDLCYRHGSTPEPSPISDPSDHLPIGAPAAPRRRLGLWFTAVRRVVALPRTWRHRLAHGTATLLLGGALALSPLASTPARAADNPPAFFAARTDSENPFDGVGRVSSTSLGRYAKPAFADIDNDGDFDVFVGADNGTISFFENTGTTSEPVFTERTGGANPLDSVDVGSFSAPALVDIDADGDLDAFVGEAYGTISFFENTGSASAPAFTEQTGTDNPFDGVNVGNNSTPAFADIDDDGDFDAFIGARDGYISFFENTDSASAPAFTEQTGTDNPFDGVNVGNNSTPAFADIDDDGDFDAFIGAGDGTITFFENADFDNDSALGDPDFTPQTGAANPFNGVDVGIRSAPTFVDIDADGDFDAFIGERDSGIYAYRNEGDATTPDFVERVGMANPLGPTASSDVYGSDKAAFADLDDDGDLDLVTGERYGTLRYFENTGSASAPTFVERRWSNPLGSVSDNNDSHTTTARPPSLISMATATWMSSPGITPHLSVSLRTRGPKTCPCSRSARAPPTPWMG